MNSPESHEIQCLHAQAKEVLASAVEGYDKIYGTGSMSCSVYDTAWVSMVKKRIGCEEQWLIPESFHFLLRGQSDDGSWGNVPKGSQIDGILSTGAALISLRRHDVAPLQLQNVSDLQPRIRKAIESFRSQLTQWRVEETRHVGFEVIVPALLEMLGETDFDFPGKAELDRVKTEKVSKFRPELLYGSEQITILHSLEAFIGRVDFDKVTHHKRAGSMMASPSSTAAYLMNVSHWDDEAEGYLRHVVHSESRFGSGGVPSAYPSTYFEYTWDLESSALQQMVEILTNAFRNQGGVIGFAPHLASDLDDTAKCIICLSRLNKDIDPTNMIKSFETESCFKTYPMERNHSFSANCNALSALLGLPDANLYSSSILKITTFLCDMAWTTDNQLGDKWNLSPLYPSLLHVEAFVDLLAFAEGGGLSTPLNEAMLSKVAIILFRTTLRTLLDQDTDGSWNQSGEETSYALLLLCEARRLCFIDGIRDRINLAINRGTDFLRSESASSSNLIWIEKVTFSSACLSECYRLAALRAASLPNTALVGSSLGVQLSPANLRKQLVFLQQTPAFKTIPVHEIYASIIEGRLIQRLLRVSALDIFPSRVMEQHKYLDLIPLTWTACNNSTRTFASAHLIYEMIVLSFLAYQVDEFMESIAGSAFEGRTDELRELIKAATSKDYTETRPESNCSLRKSAPDDHQVFAPLDRFIGYILSHQSVRTASSWNMHQLQDELCTYLLAQVMQEEHNSLFRCQTQCDTFAARGSYFQWVRTTASDHSSCPYSFSFMNCLTSALMGGEQTFQTVEEKFYFSSACRHLSTMCRMQNDYGSTSRDKIERNLNSINFREFNRTSNCRLDSLYSKKESLLKLADYERKCLNQAMTHLSDEMVSLSIHDSALKSKKSRQMEFLRLFCSVTELYGQIYIVRDMTNHKDKQASQVEYSNLGSRQGD